MAVVDVKFVEVLLKKEGGRLYLIILSRLGQSHQQDWPGLSFGGRLGLEMVTFTATILLLFVRVVYSPRCERPAIPPFLGRDVALQWNVIAPHTRYLDKPIRDNGGVGG
jgi:hypothetical protein